MKLATQTLILVVSVMSIVFVMSHSCSAQDNRTKTDSRTQQSTLRQLHPEPIESDPPKGIGLLAGYKHKGTTDFEGNQVGEISKPDGVKIKYEMWLSQGMAVDAGQRAAYVWYRFKRARGVAHRRFCRSFRQGAAMPQVETAKPKSCDRSHATEVIDLAR